MQITLSIGQADLHFQLKTQRKLRCQLAKLTCFFSRWKTQRKLLCLLAKLTCISRWKISPDYFANLPSWPVFPGKNPAQIALPIGQADLHFLVKNQCRLLYFVNWPSWPAFPGEKPSTITLPIGQADLHAFPGKTPAQIILPIYTFNMEQVNNTCQQ